MTDLEYRDMLERDLERLKPLLAKAAKEGREDRVQRLFWQILDVQNQLGELDERD